MSSIERNIEAHKRTITELLHGKKYTVEYFQREYKWERKHIEQLIVDLEAAFMSNYNEGDTLANVANYNGYYLGPVVLCEIGRVRSIVDGQQRLTSITLLLIYLNNLQKNTAEPEELIPLVFSRKGGKNSYNIEVAARTVVLDALFKGEEFELEEDVDPSVKNMYERYLDIASMFPDTLKGETLPFFIEWLKDNVVFVEILAFSNENAYTIFETMNDRGLNLTPTEMLKGYILTNIQDNDRIEEINALWKKHVSNLHRFSLLEDQEFIRAWLRSAFAETIRSTTKGAENEDFEKIGTRFHTWVKDNAKKIGLKEPEAFYYFVKGDFDFYANLYTRILSAERVLTEGLETLYLSSYWSIANSLAYPLMMAPISKLDDEETIIEKLGIISKFIDIFTVSRVINNRSITQTALRYTIYSLVLEIRGKNVDELRTILKGKLAGPTDSIDNVVNYFYQYDNRKFLHYLFARIVYYMQTEYANEDVSFDDFMPSRRRNRYVLTPIIDSTNEAYLQYFANEDELFQAYKLLGNLVLIPNEIALEFNNIATIKKLALLENQNLLASTLVNNVENSGNTQLFPLTTFNYDGLKLRTAHIAEIAKEIWNIERI
jgi:uncharacterized protein with ParB-like and HNH nuclease domain